MERTDGYASMRPRINAELAAVEDEYKSGGITWCQKDVKRLMTPYPPRKAVDRILPNLGDRLHHDDIHDLDDGGDDAAVTKGHEETPTTSSDESDGTTSQQDMSRQQSWAMAMVFEVMKSWRLIR